MHGDAWEAAHRIGIEVHSSPSIPFDVGSRPGHVIYRWAPNPAVRERRVWIGIAQCMLSAAGAEWGPGQPAALVEQMLEKSSMLKVV